MTSGEFATIMDYISVCCNKSYTHAQLEVYFNLLGDLPARALRLAARQVALNHVWATFPSIAELRNAAVAAIRGTTNQLTAIEAFSIAWRLIREVDPEQDGSFDRAVKKLKPPQIVLDVIGTMGLVALCFGGEPIAVIRAQFVAAYDRIVARRDRIEALPPQMKQELQMLAAGIAGAIEAPK